MPTIIERMDLAYAKAWGDAFDRGWPHSKMQLGDARAFAMIAAVREMGKAWEDKAKGENWIGASMLSPLAMIDSVIVEQEPEDKF